MPSDERWGTILGGVGAVAGAVGQVGGLVQQGSINKKTREWNEDILAMQRQWALDDWNMQNAYNSPEMQMARLRSAGLNPNLVYGNGATAISSQQPRSTDAKGWSPQAGRWGDMGGPAMNFLMGLNMQKDIELKELQKPVIAQDAALRAAQVLQTLQGVEGGKFDLSQRQRLADTVMATALEHLESIRLGQESTKATTDATRTGTKVLLDRNDREAAKNASDLREAVERILHSQAQRGLIDWQIPEIMERTELLELEQKMKAEDLKLKKAGIQPGDNIWWRSVTDYIHELKERARKRAGGGFRERSKSVDKIRESDKIKVR